MCYHVPCAMSVLLALKYRVVFVQMTHWLTSPMLMPLCRHFSNDHWNLQWLRLNLFFPIHLLHIQPISRPTFYCQALRLGPRRLSLWCDTAGQFSVMVDLTFAHFSSHSCCKYLNTSSDFVVFKCVLNLVLKVLYIFDLYS